MNPLARLGLPERCASNARKGDCGGGEPGSGTCQEASGRRGHYVLEPGQAGVVQFAGSRALLACHRMTGRPAITTPGRLGFSGSTL